MQILPSFKLHNAADFRSDLKKSKSMIYNRKSKILLNC